jgi:hypothetical protein
MMATGKRVIGADGEGQRQDSHGPSDFAIHRQFSVKVRLQYTNAFHGYSNRALNLDVRPTADIAR